MRPFFSYYGAKYTAAKHLGPPRRDLVIEPFAGSACYSLRWNVPRVRLYDVSPDICALWDFLINCSADDIAKIPDRFDDIADVLALPRGPQLLVRFWISKGRAEPTKSLSPWYLEYRNKGFCRVWGPAVKARIIAQKPLISAWEIKQMPWHHVPQVEAHWHVDPPYNNYAGSKYPHSRVDFKALSEWCENLPGAVDVCENAGAAWLPFRPLCLVNSGRGRRGGQKSAEVVWRKDGPAELFDRLGATL